LIDGRKAGRTPTSTRFSKQRSPERASTVAAPIKSAALNPVDIPQDHRFNRPQCHDQPDYLQVISEGLYPREESPLEPREGSPRRKSLQIPCTFPTTLIDAATGGLRFRHDLRESTGQRTDSVLKYNSLQGRDAASQHNDAQHESLQTTSRFESLVPRLHIFWVCAANETRMLESYEEIASAIGLVEQRDSGVPRETFVNVRKWLQDPQNGPWLLVLDDVDVDVMDRGELWKYLPSTSLALTGFIVITSVTLRVANKLGLPPAHVIEMHALETPAACQLFEQRLQSHTGSAAGVEDVVSMLGNIPSAVICAAAYIRGAGNVPSGTPADYKCQFESSLEARLERLRYSDIGTDLFKQSEKSLLASWQMTFDKIEQTSAGAIKLLRQLFCLSGGRFSLSLLGESERETRREEKSELRRHLELLAKYNLVDEYEGNNRATYCVPNHVRLIGQAWLLSTKKLHEAYMGALERLAFRLQRLDIEQYRRKPYTHYVRRQREELLSHIEEFQKYCKRCYKIASPANRDLVDEDVISINGEQAKAITVMSSLYSIEGLFDEAQVMLALVHRLYDTRDVNWAMCRIEMAANLRNQPSRRLDKRQRSLDQAEILLLEAHAALDPHISDEMTIDEAKDEAEEQHLMLLIRVYEELALNWSEHMLRGGGEAVSYFDKAMVSQEKVMSLRRKYYGEDSLQYIDAKLQRARINYRFAKMLPTSLVFSVIRQAKLEKAEENQRDVLNSLTQSHCASDPDTPGRLANAKAALARTLYEMRRSAEATRYMSDAYQGRVDFIGKDSLKTLSTAVELALCLWAERKNTEAETTWTHALASLEKKKMLGMDHEIVKDACAKWDSRDRDRTAVSVERGDRVSHWVEQSISIGTVES